MADNQDYDDATPRAEVTLDEALSGSKKDGKGKKRGLFGLGKKKTVDSAVAGSVVDAPSLPKDTSNASSTRPVVSPSHSDSNYRMPSSPGRTFSSSPRVASPARSQIFERDVQDSTVLKPNSPAIPTHIQTENHIPPVLDDASEAITNERLDPDAVEIVTHTSHQPAAVTVTSAGNGLGSASHDQVTSEWAAELASFEEQEAIPGDNASNYGSLDSADVRRLSFISFADVVQSEHPHSANPASSRDSIHLAGLTTLPSAGLNRSPSPIRSPVSSQGAGTSPPTSNPASMMGVEMSPPRKPMGSPGSGTLSLNPPGDLSIETMSQALRRTGSADLSNVRSLPNSPVDGPGSR